MLPAYMLIVMSLISWNEVRGHSQLSSGQTLKGEVSRDALRYDYARVLDLSLLFFEAQRSGRLPADNRIPWRRDSCLQCKGPRGANLQGGYYTSGRSLKFTFPNAAAATVLAWGLILRRDTYKKAGLLKRTEEAIKWGADYLIECNAGNEIVALVGNVTELHDSVYHDTWLRPEDHYTSRPYSSINIYKPGSDLSGEMAAALAASSIALKSSDPHSSALYLQHAKQLFNFADEYREKYSRSVQEVKYYYDSWQGYNDELIWSALWLYLATNNTFYLKYAEKNYIEFRLNNKRLTDEFSWAEKTVGAKVLLYQITKKDEYFIGAKEFCSNDNIYARKKTWGNLRYTANAAFLCLEFGEMIRNNNKFKENPYIESVIKQIHYILGDSGRSFVVGFGYRWPRFTIHVGSSCPAPPNPCSIIDRDSNDENPNILYGALIGGPDQNNNYQDVRSNIQQNGVALDHNAGFQSVIATLLYLHQNHRLPKSAYACKFKFTYSPRKQILTKHVSVGNNVKQKNNAPVHWKILNIHFLVLYLLYYIV